MENLAKNFSWQNFWPYNNIVHLYMYITMCNMSMSMYRLYTKVQVSTLFTQPRAEGPRLCKSRRDRTEVYNGLVPWATWP